MKTALFGITGFGDMHFRLLTRAHERGQLQLRAVVAINADDVPEKVAALEKLGCRVYRSVADCWAEQSGKIDLTVIPTSIASHVPLSCEAMEHGSHVYVEKPFTGSLQEARHCTETANRLGKHLMVGFQDLYAPINRRLKRMLLDGAFGEIHSINGWGSWPRPQWYFRRNNWAGKLRSPDGWTLDSPLSNAMAHFFMLLLYWTGEEEPLAGEPVELEGHLLRAQEIETFDTCSLRLRTAGGLSIGYHISHSAETQTAPLLRVEGSKGWIEWVHAKTIRWQSPSDSGEETNVQGLELHQQVLEEVMRVLAGEPGAWAVTGEEAGKHIQVINALHEHCLVVEVPGEQRAEREDAKGNRFLYVPGLQDALEHCFVSNTLLGETSGVWEGVPRCRVDLTEYDRFALADQ